MGNDVRPDGEGGDGRRDWGSCFAWAAGTSVMVDDVGIANTLCWSPDRKLFYFANTLANLVSVYDITRRPATSLTDGHFFATSSAAFRTAPRWTPKAACGTHASAAAAWCA